MFVEYSETESTKVLTFDPPPPGWTSSRHRRVEKVDYYYDPSTESDRARVTARHPYSFNNWRHAPWRDSPFQGSLTPGQLARGWPALYDEEFIDPDTHFPVADWPWYSDSTPATLDAMVAQYDRAIVSYGCLKSEVARIPVSAAHQKSVQASSLIHGPKTPNTCRFLDLPAEIRNRIYEFVLLDDEPVEFASGFCGSRDSGGCIITQCGLDHEMDCGCSECNGEELTDFDKAWFNPPDPLTPTKDHANLTMLRVCRQINQEASSIYYSQPFRFSGTFAWITLHTWLLQIGARNRALVQDISADHPAFSAADMSPSMWAHHIYPNHLKPFKFEDFGHKFKLVPRKGGDRDHFPMMTLTEGLEQQLSTLPSLRSLRITYPCTREYFRIDSDHFWTGLQKRILSSPIHNLTTTAVGAEYIIELRDWNGNNYDSSHGFDQWIKEAKEAESRCWESVTTKGPWRIERSSEFMDDFGPRLRTRLG